MTAPPIDQTTLDTAVAMLRAAGERTLRWFRAADLAVERKGDGTPVTAADQDAERFLRERARRRVPRRRRPRRGGAAHAGHHRAALDHRSDRRHQGLHVRRPALLEPARPGGRARHRVGVVHLPALGETVWAGRGLGLLVRARPGPGEHPRHPRRRLRDVQLAQPLAAGAVAALEAAGAILRTWGDGYGYALVATGRVAAMVDPTVAPYDLGPMPVLLAEAGGRFTDLDGEVGIEAGSGVATNGHVHDELLALLRAA